MGVTNLRIALVDVAERSMVLSLASECTYCIIPSYREDVMAWIKMKHAHLISTVQTFSSNAVRHNPGMAGVLSLKKIDSTLWSNRVSYDATDSTDFPRETLERCDQVILHKRCFDPFEEPRVDRVLTESVADEFILIGALTEGAVRATALGLLRREKVVTVLTDAIGSYDEKEAKLALRYMWAKGAKLSDTETLLSSSAVRLVRKQSSPILDRE